MINLLRRVRPRTYVFKPRAFYSTHRDPFKWKTYVTPNGWAIPIALGIIYISGQHLYKVSQREDGNQMPVFLRMYVSLPLRYISQCWGWLNDLTVPMALREPLYKGYSSVFDCNLDEMVETDLKKFENLGQFFYREIKPDVRTIDSTADLVAPSDGKVLHYGKVEQDVIEQVKGVTYSLNALLGPSPNNEPHYTAKKGSDLFFVVIYLAPGDYHRFHSPVKWTASILRHFAGEMFSVNPAMVEKLKHVFSLNERVSILGEWKHGFFAMVPVAATNVGKIIINATPNLITNLSTEKLLGRPLGTWVEELHKPLQYTVGEEIGGFKLGSTVVLVFEAPSTFQFGIEAGQKIQLGNPIGRIS